MASENAESQEDLVVQKIELQISKLDQKQLNNINVFDEENVKFIADLAHILADFYDGYAKHFTDDDLRKLDDKVPKFRQSSEKLAENFIKWFEKRRELIRTLNSNAADLDKRFTFVTTSRLIGSVLDLVHNLDSVFGNAISHSITNQAFGVSRVLGIATFLFFKCLPHFAYMGLVSAFAEILYDRTTMREILKINEEDTKLFAKIEKWTQETEDLDFSIKQKFPTGLDVNIAKVIENILSDYEEEAKIFTTAVFSSMKNNPELIKSINIVPHLCEIFKFSKSEAAKEWYDRSSKWSYPVGMEITKLEYRNQLIQLSLAAPEIPLEIIKLAPEVEVQLKDSNSKTAVKEVISVKLKFVPHLFLGVINCFYICSSYKELKDGAKHRHSDLLRDMAKKADMHMKKMNTFVDRYNKSKKTQ